MGDSGRDAQMVLRLGSGTNVINTNTLNVGNAFRSGGRLNFFTTTGTATTVLWTVRAARSYRMWALGGSVYRHHPRSLPWTSSGHNVDLLLSTLTITDRARMGNGNEEHHVQLFDRGTLNATTINMSRRTAAVAATGVSNTTVTFNGGTVDCRHAWHHPSDAECQHGNSGSLTSTLNITGGTVTVDGNIVQASTGTAAHSGTLNLNGGSLNMLNHNIGGAGVAAIDTVTLASGNADECERNQQRRGLQQDHNRHAHSRRHQQLHPA